VPRRCFVFAIIVNRVQNISMEVEIAEKLWSEHGFLDLWKLRIEYLNGSDENSWKIWRKPEKYGSGYSWIRMFSIITQ
jgi:hypothetical protein